MLQFMTAPAMRLPDEGALPSMQGATEWINSTPLTAADLRGKVVLVDFWTYSCINWRRQLPYVRAWDGRYRKRGLVVIGVHSPEFDFEHDVMNVRNAAKEIGVTYPIAVDNDFRIWNAFENDAWPALYLIDARGRVRYHHFGEGEYQMTEAAVVRLLSEAENAGHDLGPASVEARGIEAPAAWSDLATPETYLGYARAERFDSPGRAVRDRSGRYSAPPVLRPNHWALAGDWTVAAQAAVLNSATGAIVMRFHARDLHSVMGPAVGGHPIRFRVLLDGRAPAGAHGIDVDADGYGTATERRLYNLIRQNRPIADRRVEIEFFTPGTAAYSLTFG